MIKLEVGKKYLLNNGDEIVIIEDDNGEHLPLLGSNDYWYTRNGKAYWMTPNNSILNPFCVAKEIV